MHLKSKAFLEGSLSLELCGKQFSTLCCGRGFTVRAIAMAIAMSEVPIVPLLQSESTCEVFVKAISSNFNMNEN